MVTYVIAIVVVAFVFDFINGFHDSANSIATIVGTRVLNPLAAVVWAAFFNFIAAFTFGTGVAKTIGTGLVNTNVIDIYVVAGGLIGAIIWNIITWLLALPTSSSHALVSGIAGGWLRRSVRVQRRQHLVTGGAYLTLGVVAALADARPASR